MFEKHAAYRSLGVTTFVSAFSAKLIIVAFSSKCDGLPELNLIATAVILLLRLEICREEIQMSVLVYFGICQNP